MCVIKLSMFWHWGRVQLPLPQSSSSSNERWCAPRCPNLGWCWDLWAHRGGEDCWSPFSRISLPGRCLKLFWPICCNRILGKLCLVFPRPWSLSFLVLLQGLSQAGAQQGLKDPRSALLKQVLKIWDRCPSMPWAKMRAKMRVSKNQSESGP